VFDVRLLLHLHSKFDACITHIATLIDTLSNCRIGVAPPCTVYSTGYELPQGSPSTPSRLWKHMSEPCSYKQQKADLSHPTRLLRAETRVAQPDVPKRRPPNQPGSHHCTGETCYDEVARRTVLQSRNRKGEATVWLRKHHQVKPK
jgi:hypothetical protein